MSSKLLQGILIALMAVFVLIGACTVMPAKTPALNDLGYHSACPFAPWSTLAMLALAAGLWVLRQYYRTRPY